MHDWSLLDVGARLRSRAVRSIDVTQAQLARIAELDRRLNSYITVTADLALAQARTADAEIAAGMDRGPLHGVPIAIKDVCDIAGLPTTAGMPMRRDARASADSTVVKRLKDAGAVILGKTNLTEGVYAEHVAPYGAPVNPWSERHWPGASSSGSGVAVAAGLCYGAIGSDTGGSIRLPSAANGVTGIKPTWGRVSRHGVFELAASLDHIGPMARSAADAGAILDAIAGPDEADPTAALEPPPACLRQADAGIEALRLGLDPRWVRENVDSATVTALMHAIEVLRAEGAVVVEVAFPDPTQIVWDWFDVCAVQTALAHEATYPSRKAEYGPALAALIEQGRSRSGLDYERVLRRRADFRGRVQALFQTIDALATPVLAFPTPTSERMRSVDEEMIFGLHRFTCSFTMSGNPTITLPGGISDDGMPIAVQFVGRYFSEALLVRIGSAFQRATDWHRRRPNL